MIKKIAVLTSGGDAPGMNAAIRGVVRSALSAGLEVFGVYDGYHGLYHNRIKQLTRYSVSDMINRGGTFLGSARFPEHGIACVGIPGTFDNDVAGTDYTIGYQTALETAVEAIDRLRDTSSSHQRISIVEIMGRHCSDLTISAGIAGGCEYIVASEIEFNREELIQEIERSIAGGKRHALIVITELITDVHALAREIESRVHHETRATVLGHIQRGGTPCAFDRILASRMGNYAVDLLLQGKGGYCVGIQNEHLVHHDIIDAINNMRREFKADWLETAKRLF